MKKLNEARSIVDTIGRRETQMFWTLWNVKWFEDQQQKGRNWTYSVVI